MKALEIKNLQKTFRSNFLIKKNRVLKEINLAVEKGEIYGFLGPNGAGKTTTIKCIMRLIFPDAGEILINEQEQLSSQLRRTIGFLPENPYFYDYLNGPELLAFTGMLFDMPKALIAERSEQLLHLVKLQENRNLRLRKYSKGMLQRIGLAQALMQDPELLILDEPFSGLDPIGRKELRDLIVALKAQGKTIFFSSHILQDIEMIVDRVGIILQGRIIKEGKLSELVSESVQGFEIYCDQIAEKELRHITGNYAFRDGKYIVNAAKEENLNMLVESIIHNNGRILAVTPNKKTLEDIFIQELRESS
jgi:ABC-2 type transport system ATP-binding protein